MTIGCGCLLCYERNKMKPTNQIAAEAADNILHREYLNAPDADRGEVIAIIQAAIEKAYEDGYRQGAIDGVLNERESRAASVDIEQGEGFSIERPKKPAHTSEVEIYYDYRERNNNEKGENQKSS